MGGSNKRLKKKTFEKEYLGSLGVGGSPKPWTLVSVRGGFSCRGKVVRGQESMRVSGAHTGSGGW